MAQSDIPKIVGIVISKKGMNDLLKNIYTDNEITNFFNITWNTDNLFSIKKITKDLIQYILTPEDENSKLEEILSRGFDIQIVSLTETDKNLFNKDDTPKIVFDVLNTYSARTNKGDISIKRSDGMDYS